MSAPTPLGEMTDPTTERMRQETGHDCIACPTAVRNLMATAHNAIGELDACRTGTGDWARGWRKLAELQQAVKLIEQISDEHFRAMDGWRRP